MGLRSETLVTIAAPSRILGLLRGFARFMGLPAEARAHFVHQVEKTAGIPAAHLDVQRYQLELPGLIVHAADDQMVPVSEADLIHKAWFDSQLLRLPAGGHQRLLSDPLLLQAVLELLEQVPTDQLADYLSGILIGLEVAGGMQELPNASTQTVTLIGDDGLCERYGIALELAQMAWQRSAADSTTHGQWLIAQAAGLTA